MLPFDFDTRITRAVATAPIAAPIPTAAISFIVSDPPLEASVDAAIAKDMLSYMQLRLTIPARSVDKCSWVN